MEKSFPTSSSSLYIHMCAHADMTIYTVQSHTHTHTNEYLHIESLKGERVILL